MGPQPTVTPELLLEMEEGGFVLEEGGFVRTRKHQSATAIQAVGTE